MPDEEKEYVRKEKPDFAPEAYIRCTREGCRRYQRKLKWNDGGYFPLPSRPEDQRLLKSGPLVRVRLIS